MLALNQSGVGFHKKQKTKKLKNRKTAINHPKVKDAVTPMALVAGIAEVVAMQTKTWCIYTVHAGLVPRMR